MGVIKWILKLLGLWQVLTQVIGWLRWTWQGKDGKPCSKRITAFVVVLLYIYGNVKFWHTVQEPLYKIYLLILNALFALLLLGIVTWQNIIDLKNGIRFNNTTPTNNEKEQTTTE